MNFASINNYARARLSINVGALLALAAVGTMLALALLGLNGFRLWEQPSTGAAELNFGSTVPGMRIYTKNASDQAGRLFPDASSFGPSSDPMNGRKALGAALGTIGLPT